LKFYAPDLGPGRFAFTVPLEGMAKIRTLCFIAFFICNVAVFPANAQLPVGFGIKGGLGITDAFSPGGYPPNASS
jgi:hypothetical protein